MKDLILSELHVSSVLRYFYRLLDKLNSADLECQDSDDKYDLFRRK